MKWDNKVVWGEGLFLQPQHLQQQERYLEWLIRGSTSALTPFSYGFTRLEIDADLLTLGKFALRSASGLMPDGTPVQHTGRGGSAHPARFARNPAQHRAQSHAAGSPAWRHRDRTVRQNRDSGALRDLGA